MKGGIKKLIPTLQFEKKITARMKRREASWKGNLLLNYPAKWLHVIKSNHE